MQAVRNISGPPTGGGSDDDVDGPDTVCHLFNTWTGTWAIVYIILTHNDSNNENHVIKLFQRKKGMLIKQATV